MRTGFRAAVVVVVGAVACSGDGRGDGESGEERGLPGRVEVAEEPEGTTVLADPAFEGLVGAKAEFGQLGGAVYRIEVPDEWNGRLVLWMHGFEDFDGEASASNPDIRAYLIAQGYAWAGSSFSSTAWIPGRAADETAALWDHFARTHGRPDRTYVLGLSMGGAGAHIAAERYSNRFDGVLALCGAAGATPGMSDGPNMLAAAAVATGVTQAEYDLASEADLAALVDGRIRPTLDRDPTARDRFEDLVIDMTGGPRPFDREGIRAAEETNWRRLQIAVAAGAVPPLDERPLRLRTDDDLLAKLVAGNDLTGEVRVPLLTMHTTGDGEVPIEQARILRRTVAEAGAGDRLVQRVIRDPGHCGFTTPEQAQAFDDLVAWVEDGVRPAGNDVLTDDLAALDPAFELQPRPGTPDAERVPGARHRQVVRGVADLDGAPLASDFLGAVVLYDGLVSPCQHELASVKDASFELTLLAATEALGCGRPGAQVVLWTYADGGLLHATAPFDWTRRDAGAVRVTFSLADPDGARPPVTELVGEALGPDGRYVSPGTPIEAYVGGTLCGITSTRATGSFAGYSLMVAGPASVPGCTADADLTFHVDGHPAAQAAPNSPGSLTQAFDLTT
jgi:pimeloyl-ACP methyl ester carboxylesterase